MRPRWQNHVVVLIFGAAIAFLTFNPGDTAIHTGHVFVGTLLVLEIILFLVLNYPGDD